MTPPQATRPRYRVIIGGIGAADADNHGFQTPSLAEIFVFRAIQIIGTLLVASAIVAAAPPKKRDPATETTAKWEWQTYAEQTSFQKTARYDETVAFCKRLAAASPWIHYESFGVSPRGREMPLLIASKDGLFDPQSARKNGKRVVLVQNCIHAGECSGKDGSLMLMRDIAIYKMHADLLDHTVLVVIPIFNLDGHERFSRYGRINQNGPDEMGWRVTSRNLNLNRDYTKADTVEMRAWLGLWNKWQPDLHIDNHTTDGGDWQYDATLDWAEDERMASPVVAWIKNNIDEKLFAMLREDDHLAMTYFSMVDGTDISKGIRSGAFSPRFSHGYVAMRNRPSILVEAHAMKPYRTRVRTTYDVMKRVLEIIERDPKGLGAAVRAADLETSHLGTLRKPLALSMRTTDDGEPFTIKGVDYTVVKSDVSTRDWITYHPENPKDIASTWFHDIVPDKTIIPPRAYIIPPEWTEVIARLGLHGVRFDRISAATTLNVEQYRLTNPQFAKTPFEGRFRVSYEITTERIKKKIPRGSAMVPMNQPGARIAIHLLEPDAPDSLLSWGFFNAIFEQKEWASPRVLERLSREMMDKDPKLRRQFEKRVAQDKEFAQNGWARLIFFYKQTPYWDKTIGVYPVVRVIDNTLIERLLAHQ